MLPNACPKPKSKPKVRVSSLKRGTRSFQSRWAVDLELEAARLEAEYIERGGIPEHP